MLGATIAAGVFEGLAVGGLQGRVLRAAVPTVSWWVWTRATVVASSLCWVVGMAPTLMLSAPSEPASFSMSISLQVLGGVGVGLVFGAVLGAAQAFVLRRHVQNSGRWILPNAIGWGVALGWIFLAASSTPTGGSLGLILIIGAEAGLLSGLSIGLVTGCILRRLAETM